jgi:sugar phosphate isomerase/epimerase
VKLAFSLGLAAPLKEGPGRPPRRLETRVLDWTAGQGFDGVDVADTWTPFYDLAESELLALRGAVESRGLRILALNCFRKTLPGPDEAALARVAPAAAVLCVRVATVALFPPRGQPPETAWDEAVRAVAGLVRDGGGAVDWSIELHDGGYTATADACLRFVEQVGHEAVGVNPDLGNWLRSAAPTAAAGWRGQLRALASRANAWHVKNYRSLPTGGTLPAALPDGDIDYRWSLDVMREAGFAGPVVLEGARVGDALAAAARGRAYLADLAQHWPGP